MRFSSYGAASFASPLHGRVAETKGVGSVIQTPPGYKRGEQRSGVPVPAYG